MDIDKAKTALKQKLLEQQTILQTATDDAESIRRPHCRDAGEIAEERERAVIIDSTLQQTQQNIRLIEVALDKIADNDYGFCDHCGDDISPQRLTTVPESALCLDCQERTDIKLVK